MFQLQSESSDNNLSVNLYEIRYLLDSKKNKKNGTKIKRWLPISGTRMLAGTVTDKVTWMGKFPENLVSEI